MAKGCGGGVLACGLDVVLWTAQDSDDYQPESQSVGPLYYLYPTSNAGVGNICASVVPGRRLPYFPGPRPIFLAFNFNFQSSLLTKFPIIIKVSY